MTGSQEMTLIICVVCAAITLGMHIVVKNWLAASLVALAVCVGGVVFIGWLQRGESALWLIGVVIASGIAAGVTMAVSVVCTFVRLRRASPDQSGSRPPPVGNLSTGDDGERL